MLTNCTNELYIRSSYCQIDKLTNQMLFVIGVAIGVCGIGRALLG